MTTTAKLTLEQFLAMPETKPASEYVDGEVMQKPMPDQPAGAFADKILFYVMYGVRLTWVLDPEQLIITVYVPGREPRHLSVEDTLDGGDVLPGFAVPVERIFARIRGL